MTHRNIMEVLKQCRELISSEEVDVLAEINRIISSVQFTAPEQIWYRWADFTAFIEKNIEFPPTNDMEPWKKSMLKTYMGDNWEALSKKYNLDF